MQIKVYKGISLFFNQKCVVAGEVGIERDDKIFTCSLRHTFNQKEYPTKANKFLMVCRVLPRRFVTEKHSTELVLRI